MAKENVNLTYGTNQDIFPNHAHGGVFNYKNNNWKREFGYMVK